MFHKLADMYKEVEKGNIENQAEKLQKLKEDAECQIVESTSVVSTKLRKRDMKLVKKVSEDW